MRRVNLVKQKLTLKEVIQLARKGPVLLVAPDGKEFLISEADDFEREVEMLRASPAFQKFLDDRSKVKRTVPLEEIEREIERELEESKRS